jgi:hypothetical protein
MGWLSAIGYQAACPADTAQDEMGDEQRATSHGTNPAEAGSPRIHF